MLRDFFRCIFTPFTVMSELEEMYIENVSLFLIAEKTTSDDVLRDWLTKKEIVLTESDYEKFMRKVAELSDDQ